MFWDWNIRFVSDTYLFTPTDDEPVYVMRPRSSVLKHSTENTSSEQDVTTPLSQEQDSEATEEAMTWSVSSNNDIKPSNVHGFTILSISQGK